MGFDCYGLNPSNPNNVVKPEAIDWNNKPSEQDKEKYFKEIDVYEEAVVGSYFRNNVWWWRPLWEYVCFSCNDILTGKDMEQGQYNSGHRISATKAKRISKRLSKLLANGTIDTHDREMRLSYEKSNVQNKEVEKERNDLKVKVEKEVGPNIVPANYPEPYREEWDKIQSKEDWNGHYPFSKENIICFAQFCEGSGGFEIC
jgi:hypothetical protein